MNIEPFFWDSNANLQTLQKLPSYYKISYKFPLKSVKNLNRIFSVFECWFKTF